VALHPFQHKKSPHLLDQYNNLRQFPLLIHNHSNSYDHLLLFAIHMLELLVYLEDSIKFHFLFDLLKCNPLLCNHIHQIAQSNIIFDINIFTPLKNIACLSVYTKRIRTAKTNSILLFCQASVLSSFN
jgi:hypothetical protein